MSNLGNSYNHKYIIYMSVLDENTIKTEILPFLGKKNYGRQLSEKRLLAIIKLYPSQQPHI